MSPPDCTTCASDPGDLLPLLLTAGVSAVSVTAGAYLERNPHPIDEDDARALADRYNQSARQVLGLPPVASSRPPKLEVALSPYFAGREGGLALRARF